GRIAVRRPPARARSGPGPPSGGGQAEGGRGAGSKRGRTRRRGGSPEVFGAEKEAFDKRTRVSQGKWADESSAGRERLAARTSLAPPAQTPAVTSKPRSCA